MRRSTIAFLSIVVALGTLVFGTRALATAQGTDAPDFSGHPLVGSWSLMVEGEPSPDQVVFTDDGGYIDVDGEGLVVIGVWAPTGDTTANLMFSSYEEDGPYRVRASIQVAADGQSFTGSATFELIDATTGEGSGQYGPLEVTASRLVAEAPGTPVGTIDDLFAQFQGAPDATPVS